MRAAVVDDFARPPRVGQFAEPSPNAGEVLVTVTAAALSNLVKAQASGRHYSSGKELPFVPGNDGVGQLPDGRRVYFLGPRVPFGSMAERTVVPEANILALPEGVDDVTAAALGNPGLASWAALLARAQLQPGETVLINGGTGVSGQQAVQVAKHLGAKRVIATGRNASALQRLRDLGADQTISLEQPEEALATEIRSALREVGGTQVVLDYLWGKPAEMILRSAGGHGSSQGEPRIRYVQIGSAAGRELGLSAEWLRSSGIELLGSGLGSLSTPAILNALRTMYEAYGSGGFTIETATVPLADVEQAWNETESGRRTVFTL